MAINGKSPCQRNSRLIVVTDEQTQLHRADLQKSGPLGILHIVMSSSQLIWLPCDGAEDIEKGKIFMTQKINRILGLS